MNAELSTVVGLLLRRKALLVNVGHVQQPEAEATAQEFAAAWQDHGEIGAVVGWPTAAASWLRPAQRLAVGSPDAWVVAATPESWTVLAPRLRDSGVWSAERTVAFGALADPGLPALAGRPATEGLAGAWPDGRRWTFRHGLLCSEVDTETAWTH